MKAGGKTRYSREVGPDCPFMLTSRNSGAQPCRPRRWYTHILGAVWLSSLLPHLRSVSLMYGNLPSRCANSSANRELLTRAADIGWSTLQRVLASVNKYHYEFHPPRGGGNSYIRSIMLTWSSRVSPPSLLTIVSPVTREHGSIDQPLAAIGKSPHFRNVNGESFRRHSKP